MPAALLLGALLGWLARGQISAQTRAMFGIAALVGASFVMPFWMLPVMMDTAAARPLVAALRDASLAWAGAMTVVCFSSWAPVLRHLWALEQVGMLVRYAVWYGLAPVALCTAWDAAAQQTVGLGLMAAALVFAGVYLARSATTGLARGCRRSVQPMLRPRARAVTVLVKPPGVDLGLQGETAPPAPPG